MDIKNSHVLIALVFVVAIVAVTGLVLFGFRPLSSNDLLHADRIALVGQGSLPNYQDTIPYVDSVDGGTVEDGGLCAASGQCKSGRCLLPIGSTVGTCQSKSSSSKGCKLKYEACDPNVNIGRYGSCCTGGCVVTTSGVYRCS